MSSPFPGMDPYLEAPDLWRGFHHNLASEIQALLEARLPAHYYADVEIYLPYAEEGEIRLIAPDVYIARARRTLRETPVREQVADRGTVSSAPVERYLPIEPQEKSYTITIYDARNNLLITAIELLSPANKRPSSEALAHYQRKRARLLLSEAHLMEIDLLHAGVRPAFTAPLPAAPYFVALSRANRRPVAEVWPLSLLEPVPLLPVPLLPPDPDVPLDLNSAIAAIYQRGRYDLRIDYSAPPPPPPLPESAQKWLEERLHG